MKVYKGDAEYRELQDWVVLENSCLKEYQVTRGITVQIKSRLPVEAQIMGSIDGEIWWPLAAHTDDDDTCPAGDERAILLTAKIADMDIMRHYRVEAKLPKATSAWGTLSYIGVAE